MHKGSAKFSKEGKRPSFISGQPPKDCVAPSANDAVVFTCLLK